MANENQSDLEQRLKDSMNGPRALKPDEQHHYLGTFRERVFLTISVAQARQQEWTTTVATVLAAHPDARLILNGNLTSSLTHPYQLCAIKNQSAFVIKTDPFYHTRPTDLAVVIAADHPVYQSPIDVAKVAHHHHQQPSHPSDQHSDETGWQKLFH